MNNIRHTNVSFSAYSFTRLLLLSLKGFVDSASTSYFNNLDAVCLPHSYFDEEMI